VSVAGLIVAAGRGARATESGCPKQYRPIGGVPMITRAIGAFASHPKVDEILVVIHQDDAELYAEASRPFAEHLREAVTGGATRQDSVRAGLEALTSKAPRSVLIHDAARPFVDQSIITRVITSLTVHDGALPAVLYGHQSRIAASCGEQVTTGEVIGYVGCTGFCTGPHLHFEVRLNGTPVDPLGYLP